MTDHATLARELGFLPHAEARQFAWSKRATPRRVMEAISQLHKPDGPKLASSKTPEMRTVQLPFDDEKEWSG